MCVCVSVCVCVCLCVCVCVCVLLAAWLLAYEGRAFCCLTSPLLSALAIRSDRTFFPTHTHTHTLHLPKALTHTHTHTLSGAGSLVHLGNTFHSHIKLWFIHLDYCHHHFELPHFSSSFFYSLIAPELIPELTFLSLSLSITCSCSLSLSSLSLSLSLSLFLYIYIYWDIFGFFFFSEIYAFACEHISAASARYMRNTHTLGHL